MTIEWNPWEKEESFDAEILMSLRLHGWQNRGGKIHPGRSGIPIAQRYNILRKI